MASRQTKVNRRQFLGRSVKLLSASAVGAGLYAWQVEPHWVEVVRRSMPLANLPQHWQGKRLIQISDLHVGPVVCQDYLRATLNRVLGLQPDVVAVTGDWMTCELDEQVAPTLNLLAPFSAALQARGVPLLGILGNHDYGFDCAQYATANKLSGGLRELGVQMLRNQAIDLAGLQFAGTDEMWAGRCDVMRATADLDCNRPAVTLCHNPDALDRYDWTHYQGWILAGHTHGGQCQFPGLGAPITPIRNHRYLAGQVELGGGRRLYVNRAIGYKRKVRFMARPEITLFTLTNA